MTKQEFTMIKSCLDELSIARYYMKELLRCEHDFFEQTTQGRAPDMIQHLMTLGQVIGNAEQAISLTENTLYKSVGSNSMAVDLAIDRLLAKHLEGEN